MTSQTPPTTSSSSNFRVIFDNALEVYKKKTKEDLRSHSLLATFESCHSSEAVLVVLRQRLSAFDQLASSNESLTRWLDPTVKVLYAFSTTIGGSVGLAYPPAGVIFTGISILLSAMLGGASQDALVDVFERIETFFARLETYVEVPQTVGMTNVVVKIMAQILLVLAIATSVIQQNIPKRLLKKVVGRTDMVDALGRLDKLTQEEARMAAVQVLKATHDVNDRVRSVGDRVLNGIEILRQQIVAEFGDLNRNQLRQDIRNWLSSPDPSINFNTASDSRHEGTSTWFTQSSTFKDWKASSYLLWIHGKPGSGKSVLTSAIIQDIKTPETKPSHLAYFFFDFKDKRKQDARALISSLLVQLSSQCESFCDILLGFYSTHDRGSQQPSDGELTQCLEDMLKVPGQPIYLIIDALDECPSTSGIPSSRDKVLALMEELVTWSLPNLRLLITSRPEINIRASLEPLTSNRMSLHDQNGQKRDIMEYVSSVVHSDQNMGRWRDEDKRLVIDTLSEKADGMFRWVFCQLETLRHCLPPCVRSTLVELPETLDETYERILQEIPKSNRVYTHRLLQCLTVAARPLGVKELVEVLAIDFTAAGATPKLNEGLRCEDQEQAVLSACSSLVTIVSNDRGDRVVQFSHFSVREFLTSDRLITSEVKLLCHYHIRLEHAHTIMAQACLGVLLQLDDQIDNISIQNYPLVAYAAEHLSHHAEFESVMSHVQDGIDCLLDANKPHFGALLWVREVSLLRAKHPQRPGVPLYHVAEQGLWDLVHLLIWKHPGDLFAKGQYGTPLHAALKGRHTDVAQLLLRHYVDVDIRGFQDRTPLHFAAYNGMVDLIRTLVERNADVNSRDKNGQSPLHRISGALRNTTHKNYFDGLQCLLEYGADVDAQDNRHSTPLHLTSSHGCLKATRMLLEHGADVHMRDKNTKTPLHSSVINASSDGSLDVVGSLLEHGADVDTQDNEQSTPLHLASYHGNLGCVQLLLEHGANVHVRNSKGETPLHRLLRGTNASSSDSLDIIQSLLKRGAEMDAHDSEHSTPLHLASYNGCLEATRMLLKHGADVHARNNKGETPLHQLVKVPRRPTQSQDPYLKILSSLLEHGADVDAHDKDHSTPLHLASYHVSLLAVQLLLEHGASVHARDKNGGTPLHQSLKAIPDRLRITSLDTIDTLLRHGADVNAHDYDHCTALHLASYVGRSRIVCVLLSHGASVHIQNKEGATPFQVAMARGHREIMRLLSAHV